MPSNATHRVTATENIRAGDLCTVESGGRLRRRAAAGDSHDWTAIRDVREGESLDIPFFWPNDAWIIETNPATGRSGYVPNPDYRQAESSVSFQDGMEAIATGLRSISTVESVRLPDGTYRHKFTAR